MSETVDVSGNSFTLAILREWASLCETEINVPSDSHDSDVQRASDELRLIAAYRTMSIKAGEWPCVCGSNHLNEDSGEMEDEIIVTEGDQDIVKCPSYRPEEL